MVLHPNAGAVLVVGLGCENTSRTYSGNFWVTTIQTA